MLLVRELELMDSDIEAWVTCHASQRQYFEALVAGSAIRVASFEGEVDTSASVTAPSFEKSVSKTPVLKALAILRHSVGRVNAAPGGMHRLLARTIEVARESTPGHLFRERALVLRLKQEKMMAESLFDRLQPNLVLAFGDRHPDFEAPILVVARERGVKVVIPYTSLSVKDIAVEVRRKEAGFNARKPFSVYRWMKAAHFRDQLHEGLFNQPPSLLTAYEKFGALSKFPWVPGNGLIDVICVDSEATSRMYQKDRVPKERIRIIGDVVYDKIADTLGRKDAVRAGIFSKYEFAPDKKLIVLALPQLAEQGIMDWDSHWKETCLLVDEVSRSGQNVLISLHPRMDAAQYAFLERDYPCRIAQVRLAEFLPAADVFVAAFSSTVIWAVLCGIKTIILDLYKLNYAFFDSLESVVVVKTHADLQSRLGEVISGAHTDFTSDWEALSRNAVLDGRTVHRYKELFQELANTPKARSDSGPPRDGADQRKAPVVHRDAEQLLG